MAEKRHFADAAHFRLQGGTLLENSEVWPIFNLVGLSSNVIEFADVVKTT